MRIEKNDILCITFLIIVIGIPLLVAFSQQKSRYDKPADIYQEFEYLYRKVQNRQFKIFTTSPVLSDLQNGEIVILSSTTKNLFTRIDQSLFFAVLRST